MIRMKYLPVWLGLTGLLIALPAPEAAAKDDKEMLDNGDLESPEIDRDRALRKPDGWLVFSSVEGADKISLSTEVAESGTQSVHMEAQGIVNSYQGLYQILPVKENKVYVFRAQIHNDPTNRIDGTMRGQMSIEWRNEYDEEIRRVWGPEWNRNLPRKRWSPMEMTAQAPPASVTAVFVVNQFDERRVDKGGAFFVDSLSVQELR